MALLCLALLIGIPSSGYLIYEQLCRVKDENVTFYDQPIEGGIQRTYNGVLVNTGRLPTTVKSIRAWLLTADRKLVTETQATFPSKMLPVGDKMPFNIVFTAPPGEDKAGWTAKVEYYRFQPQKSCPLISDY